MKLVDACIANDALHTMHGHSGGQVDLTLGSDTPLGVVDAAEPVEAARGGAPRVERPDAVPRGEPGPGAPVLAD